MLEILNNYLLHRELQNFTYYLQAINLYTISFFFIFLFTELPWNQATLDISDYQNWKDGEIERSAHWQRLQDNLLLSLIKKILAHSPSKRYTLLQIRNHLWVKKKFKDSGENYLFLLFVFYYYIRFQNYFFFLSHFTIFLILFQFLDAISSLNYLSEIFVIFDEDYSMSQVENSSNMTFKKIRGEIEEKSLFTNQSFCTNNLHFF